MEKLHIKLYTWLCNYMLHQSNTPPDFFLCLYIHILLLLFSLCLRKINNLCYAWLSMQNSHGVRYITIFSKYLYLLILNLLVSYFSSSK